MLKRPIRLLGTLLLVGLVACQSTPPQTAVSQPAPSATPAINTNTPEPTATPEPAATLVADTPTPAPTVVEPSPTPEKPSTPTQVVDVSRPSPTPTRPWQIPEVREGDWVKGDADAGLVLVEYGDFQ